MGGDADRDARRAQRLDLVEVGGDGRLAHAVEAAALVGDVEQHERDAGLGGRLGRRERLGGAEVVELADRRVARRRASRGRRRRSALRTESGRRAVGLLEHPVAPRPEVGAGGAAAQRPLEGVAVAVDEAGEGKSRRGHVPTTLPPALRTLARRWSTAHRLRARAADPERADAARASPRSRSSSGCCSTSGEGRAGGRGSSSGSPRSPTSSTGTWRAAGASSRSSARSPTRSPTG